MRPGLKIFAAPTVEPLTLTAAKRQLGIDHEDEDEELQDAIVAVRTSLETELGRALVTQTWDVTYDYWPGAWWLDLPLPPLQSISSFTWTDSLGAVHTLALNTDYILDTTHDPGRVAPAPGKSWPSGALAPVNAIAIREVVGYGLPSAVPGNLKMAMLLRLGVWYFARPGREQPPGGAMADVTAAVNALLLPLRRPQYA